jgi:uncharacterized protein YbcV (DUF1398 family)
MFTLDSIKTIHSQVKSGADFPAYIRSLKQLGVLSYETFVADSHTIYFGENGYSIQSEGQKETLEITSHSDVLHFKHDLKAHQEGKTTYPTFCADCAKSGVEKWVVNIQQMTCSYFDLTGNELLVEQIPQ